MTFSLIGRCAKTGQFGMVVSSSSPAVAARCAHVRPGVGAVASQNVTDPALGPLLLDALEKGFSATEALALVTAGRDHIDYRQLMVIDVQGRTALHSGRHVLGTWGTAAGSNCAAGGNLLANDSVPQAMVDSFERSEGDLAERLMQALEAGLAAGGEAGPVYSAGLKVADRLSWPLVDLRLDWCERPIEALRAAWAVYAPQAQAYVQRAENPSVAPSYGVPGDE
ncbi:Uncharacterized conserved protein, Ntn-hydrolase superfamily [Devosia crocina]|uniref:Uncharacterized conserved protein, Ntn-hydrolase superfamily n=1 Tax=Devosia crocina TaxID=429728 RepID=A0A1I7MXY2_9HYPH|nr:DUF1028 domain-containing protein [Devosia crocina]SFV27228.1 Uncharacterized conserved protein, Ntn-hydrolase superfamily [Devosia crocina]